MPRLTAKGSKVPPGTVASSLVTQILVTDLDFHKIRELVKARTGIALGDDKREFVINRIGRRLRALNLASASDYFQYLQTDADESVDFVNAFTTNFTSFFRSPEQFELLREEVLPMLLQSKKHDKVLRVWCAAASTGEEPYSIAMTLNEFFAKHPGWDLRLLCTDIDTDALSFGLAGRYDDSRASGIPQASLAKWFVPEGPAGNREWVASEALRRIITFKKLNLMETWPMRHPLDIIFCRNVMIYFTDETRASLGTRMRDRLGGSGHLFLGQSEVLPSSVRGFRSIGCAVHRKISTGAR